MWKKSMAVLASCLFLGASVPAWAAVDAPVRTVTRTEKSVVVECPEVTGGDSAATAKINRALSSQVASFVSEASTLGGGKVHYDVHRADENIISLTVVMSPKMGTEETQGMTFDRKTGEQRSLGYYYNEDQLASRSSSALQYLYDVDQQKSSALPDTYYIDEDNSVIGLYHAGSVLDRSEGEVEVNLSAADVPAATETTAPAPKVQPAVTETTAPAATETPAQPEPVVELPAAPAEPVSQPSEAPAQPAAQPSGETSGPVTGTVRGTEVRMRSGAGLNTSILGYFEDGETLTVTRRDVADGMKWYEVTRSDGSTGWIAANYCVVSDESDVPSAALEEERKGVITGTEVRMRGDASLNGDILDYFEKGEEVTILDAADGGGMNWLRVRRSNGQVGWVAAAYCQEE
jgi:SH3-like domain-containing protein